MRHVLPLMVMLMATAMPTVAQQIFVGTWSVNTPIPDGNLSGTVFMADITTPIVSITDIKVTLEIDTTWSGDLYAYLEHDGVLSVLLNRIGRTASEPAGLGGSSGLSITLSDGAAADIHHATVGGSGLIEGEWQPDARAVDPTVVLDTSPRTAGLSNFQGLNPNGTWTLFILDADSGELATLSSWGLRITGVPVPEPGALGLIALVAGTMVFRRGRLD